MARVGHFLTTSIATGNLSTLSKQQLVDCITVDSACNDDLMSNGFVFAAKNAICTEANHSYNCLATEGTCKALYCNIEIGHGSVARYKDVSTNSEKTLMSAVTQQSASITTETDQFSFSIVFVWCVDRFMQHEARHGILVVGYGTDVDTHHWKVENSWGTL